MTAYTDYITSQHRRPRFIAVIDAVTAPLVEVQEALALLRRAFDLDTAVGRQLDRVGEWIGRTRQIATPLTDVYFSLGVEGVGFGEGTWKGPYDPDTGLVALPDDSYRLLLRAKVAANRWDGTVPGAYDAWAEVFGVDSLILIQDNQDMSMTVGVAGRKPDAVMLALLTGGYLPLKPEGVRVAYYAITTETGPLFAFGADNDALGGFGRGAWADMIVPTN